MAFVTWLEALLPGGGGRSVERANDAIALQDKQQAGLVRQGETYFGTGQQVIDPTMGEAFQRTTGGTESHAYTGFDWAKEAWRRVTGATTSQEGREGATGEQRALVSVTDKKTVEAGLDGTVSRTDEHSTSVQVLDIKKMAADAQAQLAIKLEDPSLTPEKKAALAATIARLKEPVLEPQALRAIVQAEQLKVREVMRTESSTTQSSGVKGDAYLGTVSYASSTGSTATTQDGGGTARSQSTTYSAAAAEGTLNVGRTAASSAMTTDAAGKNVAGESSSQTLGGQIISDARRGTGVGATKRDQTSVTQGDKVQATDKAAGAAVTDKGVFANASSEKTTTKGLIATSRKTSGDGSFIVDVTPVAGSVPQVYMVTITLAAGAAIGASHGKTAPVGSLPTSKYDTRSVSGGASAKLQLVYTHQLDAAAAMEYMSNVDHATTGAPMPARPEFDMISRMKALGDSADEGELASLAVAGNSTQAAKMADGDSIEMSLTGALSIGGAAGANSGAEYSGSVGVSGNISRTRKIKIARTDQADAGGKHMVDVTVTFEKHHDEMIKGSGTVEGVTVGASASHSADQGDSAMVRLDTEALDYAGKFHDVCAAMSIDAVRAMATKFTKSKGETTGYTGSVGFGGANGIALTGGTSSTQSESITSEGNSLAGSSVTGGRTDSAGISIMQATGLQVSDRNTSTTTIDKSGAETVLENERASSSPMRAISEGWTSFKGWVGSSTDGNHDARDLAAAVTMSPAERLKAQMATTYADLERYSLSESEVGVLADRARDTHEWDRTCVSWRLMDVWKALRLGIVYPTLVEEERAVNADDALALARGRVLAGFLAENGSSGKELLVAVLRYWKIRGNNVESAQDLGTHWEWPEALDSTRRSWDLAHGRARDADNFLTRLVGRPDARSRGQAWVDDTATQMNSAIKAVNASAVVQPRARSEMVNAMQLELLALGEVWAAHKGSLEKHQAASSQPASAEANVSSADATMSVDTRRSPRPGVTALDPAMVHNRLRMTDLTAQLAQFKADEKAAFAQARGLMPTELHGNLTGWGACWNADVEEAQTVLARIGDAHEVWIPRIVELRACCKALGLPETAWIVSATPGAARQPAYEPDMGTLQQLYAQNGGSSGQNWTYSDRKEIAASWRARWARY